MSFTTAKTPKTPRQRGANKGLYEFARLASSILHQGSRHDEPDSPLSSYAASKDPRVFRENKEIEVLVLTKLGGVTEQIEKAFGFSGWNVYTGKEPIKEERKVEIQEPAKPEADAESSAPAEDASARGRDPQRTGALSRSNSQSRMKHSRSSSKGDLTAEAKGGRGGGRRVADEEDFDLNLNVGSRKDADIAEEIYKHRLAVHQQSLLAPYQTQVTLERGGRKQPIAFSLAEENNAVAIAQALRQADVVFADPDVFNPNIADGQDILWLQTTGGSVDSIIVAIEQQRRVVEEKRNAYLQEREKFDGERDAIAAKKASLQARYDQHSPLLKDATEHIRAMASADLDSIRTLKKPPTPVVVCLSAIVSLLTGEEVSDWDKTLKIISTPTFKYSIMDFDPFSVSSDFARMIHNKYIKHEEFSYDKMERAHAGAGALARWLVGQVELAEASESMKPLMDESRKLKGEFDQLASEIRDFLSRAYAMVEVKEVSFALSRLGGVAGSQAAQFILAQILAREHSVVELFQNQQKNTWAAPAANFRYLSTLEVAVLGAGDVGSSIAKYLKQFGIKTKAFVRTEKAELAGFDQVFAAESKEGSLLDFLKGADYIVNTLPSTKKTAGLLNGEVLQNCKSSAVFINIGRGDIIDEASLSAALDNKWIGAAILDVTASQPLPADNALWSKPNVIITPGVSSNTTVADTVNLFVANLQRYASQSSLLYQVALDQGY